MAVDALAASTLRVNGLIERAGTIEGDSGLAAPFHIDILDTAFLFEELLMLTRGPGLLGKEQRAAIALGAIAIGMVKLVGRLHTQLEGTQRGAIGVSFVGGMPMLVEWQGSDTTDAISILVDVPRRRACGCFSSSSYVPTIAFSEIILETSL